MGNEKRYTVEAFKQRLGAAFRALRTTGLYTRQAYMCCGGCASAQLGDDLNAHPEKRGAVYYHRQDADDIQTSRHSPERGFAGGVHIRFGGRPDCADTTTVQIGREAVAALEAQGLKVEWNGMPEECIWVDGAEPTPPRTADDDYRDALGHFIGAAL